jgi:hypothetical protein
MSFMMPQAPDIPARTSSGTRRRTDGIRIVARQAFAPLIPLDHVEVLFCIARRHLSKKQKSIQPTGNRNGCAATASSNFGGSQSKSDDAGAVRGLDVGAAASGGRVAWTRVFKGPS